MKTDEELKKDMYHIVVASEIKKTISGEVSYVGRKAGSNSEDCIISVLESLNGQIQDCKLNVNVYVPDITSGGRKVENVSRISTLADICKNAFGDGKRHIFGNGFYVYLEKQRVLSVDGKDEHVINNVLRYKFNNE